MEPNEINGKFTLFSVGCVTGKMGMRPTDFRMIGTTSITSGLYCLRPLFKKIVLQGPVIKPQIGKLLEKLKDGVN
jgi:hypothetical protein